MSDVFVARQPIFDGQLDLWGYELLFRRWLAWDDEMVPRLAGRIYEERDWDRLPILADALEEAGCTQEDILAHLRGPGPHVRGCWVLNLLLGKE